MSAAALRSHKTLTMTPRREQILNLLRDGQTVPQISVALALNYYTVRDHVKLMRRAGLVGKAKAGGKRRVSKLAPKSGTKLKLD